MKRRVTTSLAWLEIAFDYYIAAMYNRKLTSMAGETAAMYTGIVYSLCVSLTAMNMFVSGPLFHFICLSLTLILSSLLSDTLH